MKLYLYYWQYGLIGIVIAKNEEEADSVLWSKCPMARPMLENMKYHGELNDFWTEEMELTSGNSKFFI